MNLLLKVSRGIDWLNAQVGRLVIWLILASVVISGANALVRKGFGYSSNAFLEIQWYLFAAAFLLAAGFTLLHQEHVKIDVVSSMLSRRKQIWIDVIGFALFLTPLCVAVIYYGTPFFLEGLRSGETSSNAGGLIRWPVYLMMPVGFVLLLLQGMSEFIKRVALLQGLLPDPAVHQTTMSAEEVLVEELRRFQENQGRK